MRELGGVFGVAVAAAVFVGTGSYASPDAFLDGFAPAVAVLAAFSLGGAIVALALPGRARAGASVPVGSAPASARPELITIDEAMTPLQSSPVVHLELHTADLPQARDVYAELCGWRPEWIETRAGSYLSVELGDGLCGGIVECPIQRPRWMPYVEIPEIVAATDRAREPGRRSCWSPARARSGGEASPAPPSAARSRSGSPRHRGRRCGRRRERGPTPRGGLRGRRGRLRSAC